MILRTARKVLQLEAEAIETLLDRLDHRFEGAVEMLAGCGGRVVTTGMGKSGIICRKIAATLSSTGTPSLFLHPAEAIHGDLGMLARGDLVLMVSNSGETGELLELLPAVKRLQIPLICLVGNVKSTLSRNADIALDVSVGQEACRFNLAPTASTTAALALGDALAIALSEEKGFQIEQFASLHPGGKLGKKLARVEDLMHKGEKIPRVMLRTPMDQVIYEMSHKGLGITAVVDGANRLAGVISDGDLRRLLERRRERVLMLSAEQCMTSRPVTIEPDQLVVTALNLLEDKKITSLMVTDTENTFLGVLHLHDLWGTEMF